MRYLIAGFFALCAAFASAQQVTVVEYYNTSLDAYFITGRTDEQSLLDKATGFTRTGMTFRGFPSSTSALLGKPSVCRYYISIPAPFTSSHFYGTTGGDCELIASLTPSGFSYEGLDFAIDKPTGSSCPANAPYPVYRSFRAAANGKTPNHRYATSSTSYGNQVRVGWAGEGIAFCSAAATDVATTAASTPAGYWFGTTNTRRNVYAIILPSGETWVMYTDTAGNNYLSGVIYAQMGWTGTTFTGSGGRDFSFENSRYFDAGITGTYSQRTQIAGTISYPALGQTSSFSGSYNTGFDLQPSLATITGTYSGRGIMLGSSTATTVSIQSSGAVIGVTASGCSFSGTIVPISNANAYRVTVTTVASSLCGASLTLSGGAYYDAPYRALNVITLDSGRTNAYVFLGTKN